MEELFYKNRDVNDLPGEVWGDYELIKDKYLVSNLGRIKILPNHKIGRHVERVLKQHPNSDGYLQVGLWLGGDRSSTTGVHRMVGLVHVPNPDNKPEVNHKKCNKLDNRATELEWNTRKENMVHAYETIPRVGNVAENNSRAQLSNAQVIDIYKSDKQNRELATQYDINISCIQNIKMGKTWVSVTGHVFQSKKPDANKIILIFNDPSPVSEIAAKFSVCAQTVRSIKDRKFHSEITSKLQSVSPPRKIYGSLKEADVVDIFTSKMSTKELSEKYKISGTRINEVKRGVAWQNVTTKIKIQ